jgi:hypothetical protein
MPSPTLPIRLIQTNLVQDSTCVGFEVVHNSLRSRFRVDDDVDMIRAHVCRDQIPPAFSGAFEDCGEYCFAPLPIQSIGRLRHRMTGCGMPNRMRLERSAVGQVVFAVDRARFAAVQVSAIAGEGDQVDHLRYFRPLPSVTARKANGSLIFGGLLDVIDHHYFERRFRCFQSQAKLLLNSRED